jgi:hypothetical protein
MSLSWANADDSRTPKPATTLAINRMVRITIVRDIDTFSSLLGQIPESVYAMSSL